MSRIVISTSSSGLDNLNINNNINLIRLRLFINNVEFIDGKNITSERLQSLMTASTSSAVYSQPAPANEITEMLNTLYHQNYTEVFITTLSSKLSESYNIIKSVAAKFQNKMDIYVYDCKDLNVCEAMLALEAEHMMTAGDSMPSIAYRLDQLRQHHKMLFAIDDLTNLIKNKKISMASGFFANILNIKPVLKMTEAGEVVAVNKIRKFERALDYMIDDFAESLKSEHSFAYVLTMGRPEIDNHFINLIKQRTGITSIPVFPVSNISLANHGPTGVGLGIFTGELPYASKYYSQNISTS